MKKQNFESKNYFSALRDLEDSYFPGNHQKELDDFDHEFNIEDFDHEFFHLDCLKAYPPLIKVNHGRKILFDLPFGNSEGEIVFEIELCGL